MPPGPESIAAVPEDAPLAMPQQSLWSRGRAPAVPSSPATIRVRRALIFTATVIATAVAAYQMYLVVTVNGPTLLQGAVLVLYILLFGWIALPFATVLVGCLVRAVRLREPLDLELDGPLPELTTRGALLVPSYNENPGRLIGRVEAIYESLQATGQAAHFDLFILSDSTDPDTWIEEEATFLDLRDRTQGHAHLFYRHRARNLGRKAGNIADWVSRFGGRYEAMLVLDADSLMTGDAIVRLFGALERHASVGIIQTLPVIVNAKSLFARLQQFANRLYGPPLGWGLGWWYGAEGNYWGHNAVIRVRAFAQAAGLPLLRGRKPFGGPILSHDFVEAALLRRQGWAVHIAPVLGGSFEEAPPSLVDYSIRDRRWCQGNLQHVGVLPARGLHWISRLHLLTGIAAYLTAPLWLAFLIIGMLISLQAQFVRPEYFPAGFALFPHWPVEDPVRAGWVFAGTMALLFAPKLLAFLAMLFARSERRRWDNPALVFLAVVLEALLSGLLAPVLMWTQSSAVLQILLGRDAGWSVQRRDDGSMPFGTVARRYGWHTLAGAALGLGAYAVSVPLLLWMSPVIAGLVLAVPLARFTSGQGSARAIRRLGLLRTPEERDVPAILQRANTRAADLQGTAEAIPPLRRLIENPRLWAAHREMLGPTQPVRRGEVNVALVVGLAKLDQCADFEEALGVLTSEERYALIGDIGGLDRLRRLWEGWHGRAA